MATTHHHSCLLGRRISVPRFHLLFSPKNPDKRSNFSVSIGLRHFFGASSISTCNPKTPSRSCLRNCAAADDGDTTSSSEDKWGWDRWNRHFSEIEEVEAVVSLLKSQLEEAVKKEDFEEAVKLKQAIAEATVDDAVAEIMRQLQTAISEERYQDASRLCNETGCGLVGWWVSRPRDYAELFGRIVHITPGVGRFIAKSYSPRQLVAGAAGTPLFEIFVVKDNDGGYVMQVVYLTKCLTTSANSYLSGPQSSNASIDDPSIGDLRGSEVKVDKKEDKLLNAGEPTEEGIKHVLKFLKDKIPGLKLKVMDGIKITEEEIVGSDDATEELVGEGIEETNSSDEEEEEEGENDRIEEISSMDSADYEKHLNTKLVIGGVLHNIEDSSIDDDTDRVSADIMDAKRDSFILHVPREKVFDYSMDRMQYRAPKEQVTAISPQGISDLMPPEVAKTFWGSEKASLKVSSTLDEMVRIGFENAQEGICFSDYTSYNRIITPESNLDPFDGLYVGAFGPYGTEIVQLKRKYGRWENAEGSNASDIEFFEYVEAVKLTGDPNVPAGQVTFRARIGNGSRMTDHGLFPEELGVLASYGGQGRVADVGFENPKWVAGKLLKLNGKGMGPYVKGADLGFLYIGPDPEKSFLVLFNRLRLPE
ncbi:PREDICTED: protein EXECUTER 2, chloroplastic-like [Camelina sativa]|uniref:Protein EXECUTER 2, chloroplastic-like n=1 Tax=Camelina sativa TaxID=90675 RepID=A0ABM0YD90_CAMSA|nr:PREDICTED: protein EXECUTER 2, chloroplastic-like [Camelina sativa]